MLNCCSLDMLSPMGHSDPVFKLHTEASSLLLFVPESSADISGAYQSRKGVLVYSYGLKVTKGRGNAAVRGHLYPYSCLFEFFFK